MENKLLKKEINWLLKEKHNNKLNEKAKKDIKKLEKGYPLAYLIGNQPFLNCKIDLKYKPLIPRPETEYWTEKVIDDIKNNRKQDIRCLDIFAGSGCVGIAILKNIKGIKMDFADIKGKNLKQIKHNLKLNNIEGKHKFIKSNLFDRINDKYDYIFANPPYIAHNDKSIQLSVKKYEPKNALYSKNNGLEIIEKFLRNANGYLNQDGKICIEFGYQQKKNIETLLKKFKYERYSFYKDQYGRWRWIEINK
ncbi:peptide chain release factor N(5)-glutamine methyltransferase [bacterium]|nr:MAG: peptide chain release factor N(5)-glutamine methyltransferase [bacterium]